MSRTTRGYVAYLAIWAYALGLYLLIRSGYAETVLMILGGMP